MATALAVRTALLAGDHPSNANFLCRPEVASIVAKRRKTRNAAQALRYCRHAKRIKAPKAPVARIPAPSEHRADSQIKIQSPILAQKPLFSNCAANYSTEKRNALPQNREALCPNISTPAFTYHRASCPCSRYPATLNRTPLKSNGAKRSSIPRTTGILPVQRSKAMHASPPT